MSDLPELTFLLGPQTFMSLALNNFVRTNRPFFAQSLNLLPSRIASPILRRASDARPEKERVEEFEKSAANRPAFYSSVNFFGPPHAALLGGEMFPSAETMLAGLASVSANARIILCIDSLPTFFLSARSDVLESRVRRTPWELLYELSWADLIREVVETLPAAEFLVLTPNGTMRAPQTLLRCLFGPQSENAPGADVFLKTQITETGHAVLARVAESGPPGDGTLAEIYASFARRPGLNDMNERLGIDKTTSILLAQRFEEDLEEMRSFDRTEVI